MELLRTYSKLPKLTIPIQITPFERPKPPKNGAIRRRLGAEQITQLCEDYRLGATTRSLSERYGIGKTAVSRILRDRDVALRHQGLSASEVLRATELYGAGKSVAQVAGVMGLTSSSVHDALTRAGVALRHRPGVERHLR